MLARSTKQLGYAESRLHSSLFTKVEQLQGLRDWKFKAELGTIIVMQNRPKGIFLQSFAKGSNADPHLCRKPWFTFAFLILPCCWIYIWTTETRCLPSPLHVQRNEITVTPTQDMPLFKTITVTIFLFLLQNFLNNIKQHFIRPSLNEN